ncbi:MAG: nucleotidyltransferase domain-containing protein [Bryobacterales bacterium]|nr:nucleotidyltransferase domain-containing protein [Bryobacterales bacterium]
MTRKQPLREEGAKHTGSGSNRQPSSGSTLDPRELDEIIRRVVEVAQPDRIVLFGAAARGEMTRNSDVDLLMVKDSPDALELMIQIYRRLRGVGVPVDAIVVSPDDLARYRDSHALIIKPALREGRTVYEAG